MPSTNGHGPKRAILYARVSSDDQVRGYSLDQQIGALQEWSAREGYEVVEEVRDEGWSGAYLERPGLDRVRDLVEARGVGVVVAQDADRISRDPAHRAFLDGEFERFGTRLIALDDWGDDTHEGELLKYLKGWVSKGERLKIAERSRRGTREKARRGEVVGQLYAPLGFRYTLDRKALEVDLDKMTLTRRIFEMAAAGRSLLAIKKTLERDGVPTPRGNRRWSLGALHRIVNNDVYRSRSVEELREITPPGVADKLDPEKRYGVWWWGRQRHHQQYGRELGPDGRRRYHKGRKTEDLPQEQWVAIPVPDCGLPPELVDRARTARAEYRQPATTGYFWQLSGGIIRCGGCGHAMSGVTAQPRKDGTRARHYRCHHRARNGAEACSNKKQHRAEKLEAQVWEEVSALLKDPERLRAGVERMLEEQRAAHRGDVEGRELRHWQGELDKVERMRSGYLDQQAEGIISMAELKTKLAALDERRTVAERELDKLMRQQERMAQLERDTQALMERYRFEAHEGLDLYTPQDKHDAYKTLGIKVIAHPDGSTELTGSVLVDDHSDSIRAKPFERSQLPLSTGARRPLFTVTPPVESR
jgi:site-specific DNA recombinase